MSSEILKFAFNMTSCMLVGPSWVIWYSDMPYGLSILGNFGFWWMALCTKLIHNIFAYWMEIDMTRWSCPWNGDQKLHKKNYNRSSSKVLGSWGRGYGMVKVNLSNSKINMIAVEQCVRLGFSWCTIWPFFNRISRAWQYKCLELTSNSSIVQ